MAQLFVKALIDLFAQIADVHVHDVRAALVIEIPDVIFDLFAGKHNALVVHEVFQQRIFPGGKRNFSVPALHAPRAGVQRQIARDESAVAHAELGTRQHAQPGTQFLQREGLHQIVVRAAVQPGHAVGDGVARGEQQHGRGFAGGAQLFEHAQPVQMRHHDVQYRRVVIGGLKIIPSLQSIKAAVHAIALGDKAARHKVV